MQRLSIRLALVTAILSLFGSFTKIKIHKHSPIHTRQSSYYWYSYPGDSYNDYQTLAEEEWEMWVYYDAPVNTDPAGGTLIEKGYINNTEPHEFPPSYFLYVHY